MFKECCFVYCSFFVNDTASTEIYTYIHTLSLHDALPIGVRDQPGRHGLGFAAVAQVQEERGQDVVAVMAQCDLGGAQFAGHANWAPPRSPWRSEEHTSELQSLMRISYAVFCLKKKNTTYN